MNTPVWPPGPKGHALLGSLPEFRRDPLGFQMRCAHDYGDIARYRIVNVPVFQLNHPAHIETVLVHDSHNFVKGRLLRANRRVLGDGLLTSEGALWLRQRRLIQPAFHRDHLATYGEVIVALTERMLATWRDGERRDLHRDMKRLTLEIAAKTLFDVDVVGEADATIAALEVVREQFVARARSGLLIPERIPTPGNVRLERAVRQLEDIVSGIIQQRRAGGQDHGDLLSILLYAQYENGAHMADRQLRDEVMTLFIAGHETTAIALTWICFLLTQHPDVEARLLAELQSVLGMRRATFSDLPSLIYSDSVIKESLRLYPPIWSIPRVALHDFNVGGYTVPAGASVTMSLWVMHHDPRYFEHPEAFDPERWRDDRAKQLPKFAYFPFGGGPRLCIGQAFAMMEIMLVLTTVMRQFHLALASEQPITPLPSFTLQPMGGVTMRIYRRVR